MFSQNIYDVCVVAMSGEYNGLRMSTDRRSNFINSHTGNNWTCISTVWAQKNQC